MRLCTRLLVLCIVALCSQGIQEEEQQCTTSIGDDATSSSCKKSSVAAASAKQQAHLPIWHPDNTITRRQDHQHQQLGASSSPPPMQLRLHTLPPLFGDAATAHDDDDGDHDDVGSSRSSTTRKRSTLNDTAFFVRSFDGHAGMLAWLVRSVEVFVPPEAPLVVVVDPGSNAILHSGILPERAAVFEERLPKGEGYAWIQFAYLFADMFVPPGTEFVAMMDADMVFQAQVTRDRLFVAKEDKDNVRKKKKKRTTKKMQGKTGHDDDDNLPLVLWHDSTYLTDRWRRSTEELLGMSMTGDFMVQLPFVVPTFVFPALREHVMTRHNVTSLHEAWKMVVMDKNTKYQKPKQGYVSCQFCILGSFMWHKYPDHVAFRNPPADNIPTLRVARHLGWEPFAYDGTERRNSKLSPEYAVQAARAIHEGHCTALAYRHDRNNNNSNNSSSVVMEVCGKFKKLQQSLYLWQGENSGPLPTSDEDMYL